MHEIRTITVNVFHKQPDKTWGIYITNAIDIQRERQIQCGISSSRKALYKVGLSVNCLGRLNRAIVQRQWVRKGTPFGCRI